MRENVRHDIQDDRRGGTLRADDRREGHDAVGLAAHQADGCGIVECKSAHGHLIKPPERDLWRFPDYASNDNSPREGVEHVQEEP